MKFFSVVNISNESLQTDSIVLESNEVIKKVNFLFENGADFIDLGGRSTCYNKVMIDDETEQQRLKPILSLLEQHHMSPISLDTWSFDTALTFLEQFDVLNYTGTCFPNHFVSELANSKCPVILNFLRADNPYELRKQPYKPFQILDIIRYFQDKVEFLQKKGVNILAIDPNWGVWHPDTPELEKPSIRQKIIEHIGVLREIAPVFIGTPRRDGVLNVEIAKMIISHNVDFIRTHDIQQLKGLIGERYS
ncbi:MAG: dihydropteroate synthase [Legionellaceae bacterium]|nr:dihydropteroate synthase [Legionellaceae bacterium]